MSKNINDVVFVLNTQNNMPMIMHMYVGYDSNFDTEIKISNRNSIIDYLVEEKEHIEFEDSYSLKKSFGDEYDVNLIGPKVFSKSISLTSSPYNESSLFDDCIREYSRRFNHKIDHNKSDHRYKLTLNNTDKILSFAENNETQFRKLINNIIRHSNIIAMEGRVGPANLILMEESLFSRVYNKFGGTSIFNTNSSTFGNSHALAGMTLIPTDLLPPNRTIIVRKPTSKEQEGLILFVNEDKRHALSYVGFDEYKMISGFDTYFV